MIRILPEDKDFEYYRNRCDILEKENHQLKEKITRIEEEFATIKETVSALVARNINASVTTPPRMR